MEYHKGLMKISLAENLRSLMQKHLFEKITIKQICDETGVIRATFYNYFEDKYDCLNWIVYHDLVENTKNYIVKGDIDRALTEAMTTLNENKVFYRAAYQVTGQNSFEDMVRNNLKIIMSDYFARYRKDGFLMKYSNDLLAMYYAESIAFAVRIFVFETGGARSVDEIKQMIMDLMKNSFFDFSTMQKP